MGLVTKRPKITPTPRVISFERSHGPISFDVVDLFIFPSTALESLEQIISEYKITWLKYTQPITNHVSKKTKSRTLFDGFVIRRCLLVAKYWSIS